jgi:hypothetical protein
LLFGLIVGVVVFFATRPNSKNESTPSSTKETQESAVSSTVYSAPSIMEAYPFNREFTDSPATLYNIIEPPGHDELHFYSHPSVSAAQRRRMASLGDRIRQLGQRRR